MSCCDWPLAVSRGSIGSLCESGGVPSSGEIVEGWAGQRVRVAGLVVVRQRPPTAKGHLFITLEDEEGPVNLIVRPDVYERYRDALRNCSILLVEGRLQREGNAVSLLVCKAATLRSPDALTWQ